MLACAGLGIFTEWRFAPFNVDDSIPFFVAHLHDLSRTAVHLDGRRRLLRLLVRPRPPRRSLAEKERMKAFLVG